MNILKSILGLVLMCVVTSAFAWFSLGWIEAPPNTCRDLYDWTIYGAAIAPFVVTVIAPAIAIAYVRTNNRMVEFVLMIFNLYAFVIVGYAMAFYAIGIEDTAKPGQAVTAFTDYLYYSAVTFTTLGYGDFRPCSAARVYAAAEALFGGFFMPFSSAVIFLSKFLRDHESANT